MSTPKPWIAEQDGYSVWVTDGMFNEHPFRIAKDLGERIVVSFNAHEALVNTARLAEKK